MTAVPKMVSDWLEDIDFEHSIRRMTYEEAASRTDRRIL